MKTFGVLVFLLCFSTGSCLKCYTCTTTKSWDECKEQETQSPSDTDDPRCIKADVTADLPTGKVETFVKGCSSKEICDDAADSFQGCKEAKAQGYDVQCNVNCCSGELCNCSGDLCNCSDGLCNSATNPAISIIMLFAGALLAFIQ